MKTILTQTDALEIYNSGSEFVIKTLMEQNTEIEILKRILEADIKRIEIEKTLSELNALDIEKLDEEVSNAIRKLLQIIESLNEENIKLRREIEYLKGKKKRSPSTDDKSDDKKDQSSEKERKERETCHPAKEPKSKSKKHKIKIDRTEICQIDKSQLPSRISL